MNHCPCLFSHLYFLKTYSVSNFSSCVFFLRLSSQILYLRMQHPLSYSYELNFYFHRPIRHRVTHETSKNLDMFVHYNALCFFHPWCTVFKASNISLWEKKRDSFVFQSLWLCNNRFLLLCDLLLEGSPPQYFRLFSLSFYSLSAVYSMSVNFKLSTFVSFSVLFCIFARTSLSLNLINHPSAKILLSIQRQAVHLSLPYMNFLWTMLSQIWP